MNARERFQKTLNFQKPDDRLPMIEWAAWWNKTIERWKTEGLPEDFSREDALKHFGLDILDSAGGGPRSEQCPQPAYHGAGIAGDNDDYEAIRPCLFTSDILEKFKNNAYEIKERHDKGEIIVRVWLDGYFWFPRTIFGIERHMYAFYDHPQLMHRMNAELSDFNIRVIEELFPILKPDMVGFAEDMSYNHGPMLSYELFKEFLTPYYQKTIPYITKHNVKVLVDSDGDITEMVPWLLEAGIQGVYPLEKQAGVDIVSIRKKYPEFLMMGGYDKMVMPNGEEAMRKEFERLLPVMKSGGYINSVDHQTPPGVSLENYKIYLKLLKEYCEKAVTE